MIGQNQKQVLQIGVVGLGLIGGSFAKAYRAAGHRVLAYDLDEAVLRSAKDAGDVAEMLDEARIGACDLILICLYPAAAASWMEAVGPFIGEKPLVIDCCGTKRGIFAEGVRLAQRHGFRYLGGHPMAGTQFSGYANARADLFAGAPMVLVPEDPADLALIEEAKALLAPAGFATYSSTTAEVHDRLIAFTSQLAHVVSNAYVKSPTAQLHEGFSAGSYRDLTRVAWLNPEMWTELFLDNRDHLIEEIDLLIGHLNEYKEAMQAQDRVQLFRLLEEGRRLKEQVDA